MNSLSLNSASSAGTTAANAVMTIEQLLALCVQLQPVEAAARADSTLCVTPLITRLLVDGELVKLELREGQHGAAYPRVSGEVQRAAGSAAGKDKRKRLRTNTQYVEQRQPLEPGLNTPYIAGKSSDNFSSNFSSSKSKGTADGFSEEEQLTRQIRYFVRERLAFKVYSDCGLTGEYPSNDPRLIRRLLEGKAARYRKIYERTLLDETSLQRRTPEQIALMRAYLDKRVAQIKSGLVTDDEFAPDGDDLLPDKTFTAAKSFTAEEQAELGMRKRQPGRPRRKVYFRQAFTQLWQDIATDRVCTVAVSDRSRLCRSADLESEFLMLLSDHNTRLVGLIEDLTSLDVSDPLKRGFSYMIASVNEYRLEEICGHVFRGFLQLLESGHPHSRLPWWLLRDGEGRAIVMPEYAAHARRVVDLYLSGLGVAAIVTKMHAEGVRIGGEPLTYRMVGHLLDTDAVSGIQWQFGMAWDILPPLLTPEVTTELRERRQSRRDILIPSFGERQPGRTWANHLFTGLLRCSCGLLLAYSSPNRNLHTIGKSGYYYCRAPHKRAGELCTHAWISEAKLSAFLNELLGENPDLIANALSAGGDRAARSTARRALIEERLQQARQEYEDRRVEAQAKAVQVAEAAGIGSSSASFGAVVAEICRGLLDAERESLTQLEAELAHLGAEAGQDKQTARALGALEQLHGTLCAETITTPATMTKPATTASLDVATEALPIRTRNSLLKAIFSEITIYPLRPKKAKTGAGDLDDAQPHGCLLLRLPGIETPLPPIRMRRGQRKDLNLPTVGEWITDIYALAPVEEPGGIVLNARTMLPFHRVFVDTVSADLDTPLGRLAACIQADENFPRRSKGQETIDSYLAKHPQYETVREYLDEAWLHYRAMEKERLLVRKGHGKNDQG